MTTTESLTIAERVANGASFLDKHNPGWHQRIELSTLFLNSPCRCVLGQLYGQYSDGLNTLGLKEGSHWDDEDMCVYYPAAAERGFESRVPISCQGEDDEWDALTAEWVRVISARREAVSS